METPFDHVVIIGCGLLGASLGMALRKRGLAKTVTGVGRQGSPSMKVASQRGAADRVTDDASAAVRDCRSGRGLHPRAAIPGNVPQNRPCASAGNHRHRRRLDQRGRDAVGRGISAGVRTLHRLPSHGRQREKRSRGGPRRPLSKCGLPCLPSRGAPAPLPRRHSSGSALSGKPSACESSRAMPASMTAGWPPSLICRTRLQLR